MMSFQTLYTRITDLAVNTATSPTNIATLAKALLNETQHLVLSSYAWPFLETTQNLTSVADQEGYELGAKVKNNQLIAVRYEESSSVIRQVKIVQSADYWEYLQSLASASSNAVQCAYVQDEQVLLWPKPASASKTIRIRFRKIVKDMTADDYTTGTISAWTNGATAITGSGTTFTAAMVGRHIRVTSDGFWYEIASRNSNTAIASVKSYEGTTIAAGSEAYTIGEMPAIPESYQNLLVWRPLMVYYMMGDNDMTRADRYAMLYDGGYERGLSPSVGGLLGQMMEAYAGTEEAAYLDEFSPPRKSIYDFTIPSSIIGESW